MKFDRLRPDADSFGAIVTHQPCRVTQGVIPSALRSARIIHGSLALTPGTRLGV